MASLTKTKTLFAFTSPRTLEKIIPEISILTSSFSGMTWSGNERLQAEFFDMLCASDFYEGSKHVKDPAFAARDRVTRAPKSLGFVQLNPSIALTAAGKALLEGDNCGELFTRQLLKFQLPSYYHTQSKTTEFSVRPYLELLRLIKSLGSLSKTEVAIFFLQLTNYNKFSEVKGKIEVFRDRKKAWKGNSKEFVRKVFESEITSIYQGELQRKCFKTRESDSFSFDDFIKTKMSNMLDYADAFSRYIRSTELVTFKKQTYHLIISPSKVDEVDFLLRTIPRKPCLFSNLNEFQDYLFNPYSLELLSDNRANLLEKLKSFGVSIIDDDAPLDYLKKLYFERENQIRERNLINEVLELKSSYQLQDVFATFKDIENRLIPDLPLFLEWNVWRAFVVLNHAIYVNGHFKVDIDGMPVSTAPGNIADIEVEFEDFVLIVEVTLSSGATQFKMEGDSVPRHYGVCTRKYEKDVFCLFIAPRIDPGCLAFFYNINKVYTHHYGGKTKIIPLSLDMFIEFFKVGIRDSFNDPGHLYRWLVSCMELGEHKALDYDERAWQNDVYDSIELWCK